MKNLNNIIISVHNRYKLGLILILWTFILLPISAQRVISITEFGLQPNTGENARLYLNKAIEACTKISNVTLSFPEGRYDFFPDYDLSVKKDVMKQQTTTGIVLNELNNFTLDGGGAQFIFHGKMQIATVNKCINLTLRNFTVDWERPFISQAEIVNAQDSCLDIKVDKDNYPYRIENGRVLFIGEGWELPIMTMYSTLYNKTTKDIYYNTWDSTLGNIFEQRASEISTGVIRFHGTPKFKPKPGTAIVSLFHVRYFAQGISIQHSKDILLKDISLYHTLSNGFSGYRTENITMDNASVVVNDEKGRYFSSVADASHFSECAGLIKVVNCAHTGQGDDFINVHGTSVKITDRVNTHSILVPTEGKGSGGSINTGDDYWFIRGGDAQRKEIGRVVEKTSVNNGKEYRISFADPIPEEIKGGDFLECKTWCASLELRKCKISKRHRARGILVTTPKDVVIEDNYFSTAGTAILIEGDFNYWYESGANNNVQIRNNVFDNCLTSGNKNGSRAEWGEAVITITPSHIPQTVDEEPYHKNIHISNNLFKVFDAPLVRAVSTRGLYFTGNTVVKTKDYKPYTWQKAAFLLDGCRDVTITDNKLDTLFTTRDILIEHMRHSDVETDPVDKFIVKEIKEVDTHMQW